MTPTSFSLFSEGCFFICQKNSEEKIKKVLGEKFPRITNREGSGIQISFDNNQPKFKPNSTLQNFKKNDWKELTQDLFSEIFQKSPVKRTKFSGLKRNIEFLE